MTTIEPYVVIAVQPERIPARLGGKFKENIQRNLRHYCELIECCCGTVIPGILPPVKLITFHECTFSGAWFPINPGDKPMSNREIIENLAVRIPGEETDVLAEKAKQYKCYIAAGNWEYDPEWPNFHFNTGFIINPDGKIILKYRKTTTNVATGEISCSPHDIMDAYKNPITNTFDPFPVVDTSIGRLAMMICSDIRYPELPRIYSMKGAEVLLRPSGGYSHSEGGLFPIGVVEATLRTRAADNAIYLVNADVGPALGRISPTTFGAGGLGRITPATFGAGGSVIIDYMGNELAKAPDSGETFVRAWIDIAAVRKYRETYWANPVTIIRSELFAPYYSKTIFPPNTFIDEGPIENIANERHLGMHKKAMENLTEYQNFYRETDV